MNHLNENVVLHEMNLQEVKETNGGIGTLMLINPLLSELAFRMITETNNK